VQLLDTVRAAIKVWKERWGAQESKTVFAYEAGRI
jgi:hypothetical protein